MQLEDKENYSKVISRLSVNDDLRDLFVYAIKYFSNIDSSIGIVVQGSIATNMLDEYSDIDLLIVLDDIEKLHQSISGLEPYLLNKYRILASFTANHINRENLFVFYLKKSKMILKLDIQIEKDLLFDCEQSNKYLIIRDSYNIKKSVVEIKEIIDYNILYKKFSVWLWYIFYLIERGEYFQAARSIDFSRENALLPIIRHINGLSNFDGHRRIELLLPKQIVNELKTTYPKSLTHKDLKSSLENLMDLFEKYWIDLVDCKHLNMELFYEIKKTIVDKIQTNNGRF